MRRCFKKFVTCVTLCVATLLSSIPAQAAGIETWYKGVGNWNNLLVTNTNLTPVKTMGDAGNLTICFGYSGCRDGILEPTWYPPTKVTVQIRDAYTGTKLATGTFNEEEIFEVVNVTAYNLPKGKKVQIFFDVSSQYNAPGPYRKGNFSYVPIID